MTITVIDPRAAEPVITTATPLEVAENTTAVATLQASDAGGGTITWSKGGGADASRFALSRAGVLRFDSAPDYEAPRDKASTNPANGAANNEYVVKVKASNGTANTTLALVVRVRNANDPPSAGTVTIADTPLAVGVALTASVVGIADPDGVSDPLPLSWQWYRRRAGSIETAIAGATSATYTVSGHDVEATLTAQATYTDGGGFANTLASAPSARVPQAGALAHVSIAAERASYTAGLDDAVFTLRRSGSTAAPLSVAVGLTQQRPFLSADTLARRVHFATGNASAELRLARDLFADHALTQGGTLTATVAPGPGYVPETPNAASVQMVVADPAVTVRLEQAAYTFAENATGAAVVLVARTEPGVPPPNRSISVFLRTEEIDGQAQGNGIDFRALSAAIAWQPSDFSADGALFTARREIALVLTDDAVDEPDETLQVALETVSGQPSGVALRQPDGAVCPAAGCRSTVTISDDDPADAALSSLALSGIELTPPFDAATLSYSAAVSTGVASTTLSAAARAPASTVEIKPDDADGSAPGHQVALELTAGASKDITAEVTSADGSAIREYTVTVTGVNADTPLPVLQHSREIGSALTVANVKAEFEMYLYFAQTPNPVGFTEDDVVVYNGEVTAFEAQFRPQSDFTWYHTTISVDEGAGEVTVAIPANVIEEGNRQAQRTFGVDVEGPAIDLAVSVGVDEVVSGDFTVTITFSEAVLEDPGQHETIDDERLQWRAGSDITITNGGLVSSYQLGTSSKRFQAVVHPKDDYEGVLTFTIRAGAVDDAAGNPNATAEFTRRMDTKKPSVTDIDITSTPADSLGYGYATGETITLGVRFHEPVTVAGESLPSFDIKVGGETRRAGYVSGTGTDTLSFSYTVQAADLDADGISYAADSIELNGATIHDAASNEADMTHAAMDDALAHQVNTTAPEVRFEAAAASAEEGEDVAFTVRLSVASALPVTVHMAASVETGDTASSDDFTAVSETLTFPAGETSKTVTVATVDDATDEADETFTLRLSNATAATLPADPTATGTILDNDDARAHVSIAAERASYTAGLDDAVFTLRRSGSTAAPLSVAVGLTQQRPFLSADTLARRVHFATGNASAELRLARDLFADHALTQGGTLTAAVAPGPDYVPGTPNAASVQMVVADPAVTVRLEQAAYTFAENLTGAAVVLVARTEPGVPPPNRSISVFLRTEEIDGQAQGNGIDFRALSAAIAWQPSDFSADEALFTARREITLVLTDDTVDEPDETLQVALETVSGQPSGVALRQPDGTVCPAAGCRSTVTISDDDPADAALSSLALSGIELTPPFDAATPSYSAAVSTGVASTTLSAAARAPASTVEIKPDDADGSAPGHQVALDLTAGASKDITAKVTSADGSAIREYTVTVTGVNTDTPLPVLQHSREIDSALTVTNVKAEFEMYLYFEQTPNPVGFTADDVVVYNGKVTAFEAQLRGGSFTRYHTTISVDEGASTVTVAIPANVIEGGNRQAQRTFGVDVEGPAIGLAAAVGEDAVVSDDFTVTITFSEAVLDPGQHESVGGVASSGTRRKTSQSRGAGCTTRSDWTPSRSGSGGRPCDRRPTTKAS